MRGRGDKADREGRKVKASLGPYVKTRGAVNLVLSGVPAPVVQGQPRHVSLSTTQRYFELTEEARLELIRRALGPGGGAFQADASTFIISLTCSGRRQ